MDKFIVVEELRAMILCIKDCLFVMKAKGSVLRY